jgi:hypothetical protein
MVSEAHRLEGAYAGRRVIAAQLPRDHDTEYLVGRTPGQHKLDWLTTLILRFVHWYSNPPLKLAWEWQGLVETVEEATAACVLNEREDPGADWWYVPLKRGEILSPESVRAAGFCFPTKDKAHWWHREPERISGFVMMKKSDLDASIVRMKQALSKRIE